MNAQTLFTNYIIAGVEASLARVQAAEYVVPEADRQQAWQILSFALKVEEAWPVTRELLLALAPKMEMAGFREEWIPYLEKGIQCALTVDDTQVMAECELHIGLLYRLLNQFEKAKHWTYTSIDHFVTFHDTGGQARALNELAWLAYLESCNDEAKQYVEQALKLLPTQDLERAMSYRVQGMIAAEQKQLSEAESFHRKALTMFEQQHDRRRSAWSLQNLAYTIVKLDRAEEAIAYYEQALTILKTIGDRHHCAIVHLNLSYVFVNSGKSSQALIHLTQAEEIFQRSSNQLQLARIAINFGLAYLSLKEHKEAKNAFKMAICLYDSLGEKDGHLNAMDGLAMVHLASNQYEEAIEILSYALNLLPTVTDAASYDYLWGSLHRHLREAKQGRASTNAHL